MSSNKVGEIFTVAGAAFNKLGELAMQLHPSAEPTPSNIGKWTDEELEMLKSSVKRFGDDLNQISDIIKTRTISQIKSQMKKKAYDEAGLEVPDEKKSTLKTSEGPGPVKKQKTSEVTLSALNAPEVDVDIEGLSETGHSKKLEFDSDVDSSIL